MVPHGKYSSGIRHANFLFNAELLAGLFVLPCAAAVPDAAQNQCHIFQCGRDALVCGGPAGPGNHSRLKIYPFLLHWLFQTQITSSVWLALWAMNNWHNGGAARCRSKQQGAGAACLGSEAEGNRHLWHWFPFLPDFSASHQPKWCINGQSAAKFLPTAMPRCQEWDLTLHGQGEFPAGGLYST